MLVITSLSTSLVLSKLRHLKWAAAWQNQPNDLCGQQRLGSTWASAQSDQSLLSTWRNIGPLTTCWVHSEHSDQTAWMPRLILDFAWHTPFCWFCCGGSNIFFSDSRSHLRLFLLYILCSCKYYLFNTFVDLFLSCMLILDVYLVYFPLLWCDYKLAQGKYLKFIVLPIPETPTDLSYNLDFTQSLYSREVRLWIMGTVPTGGEISEPKLRNIFLSAFTVHILHILQFLSYDLNTVEKAVKSPTKS